MLTQIESAFAERTSSEQRLRRFVADASHELRTPLTSIRGYAELLRGGAAGSPRDTALARRRIEDEAVRMSVLVDDMLLLARLDQLARSDDLQAKLRHFDNVYAGIVMGLIVGSIVVSTLLAIVSINEVPF